jgi:hypothetical protein
MKQILRRQNSWPFRSKYIPAKLQGESAVICLRTLMDESGMIGSQMGMQNKSENGRSVWDVLRDTTP